LRNFLGTITYEKLEKLEKREISVKALIKAKVSGYAHFCDTQNETYRCSNCGSRDLIVIENGQPFCNEEKAMAPTPVRLAVDLEVTDEYPFESVFHYATSGAGIIILNPNGKNLEERVEEVIAHETVHCVIDRIFGEAPLAYVLKIHKLWDMACAKNLETKEFYEEKYARLTS
jgi:spore maturation protein CgeB